MPWYPSDDDPECPECGSDSGECGCERPFDYPFVYFEFKDKKEKCVKCGINSRYYDEDGDDFDLCSKCLNNIMDDDEYLKHIIKSAVIA